MEFLYGEFKQSFLFLFAIYKFITQNKLLNHFFLLFHFRFTMIFHDTNYLAPFVKVKTKWKNIYSSYCKEIIKILVLKSVQV